MGKTAQLDALTASIARQRKGRPKGRPFSFGLFGGPSRQTAVGGPDARDGLTETAKIERAGDCCIGDPIVSAYEAVIPNKHLHPAASQPSELERHFASFMILPSEEVDQ